MELRACHRCGGRFLRDRYYLYYATRTPDYSTQIIGVAMAPAHTDFSKQAWKSPVNHPVLVPEYPWEEKCVEGASVVQMGDEMFMFYAGAYNNRPQQIGVAKSSDGIHWTKLSNKPFLMNGDPGTWNCCESGHPHLFKTRKGKHIYFIKGMMTLVKLGFFRIWRSNGRIDILLSLII